MRSRNIKPGFFRNEVLGELPAYTRLLFIGLWTLADREGRLEDRPKRIKVELFPFDNVDVGPMLTELQAEGFIVRYEIDGKKLIEVENFVKHQDPHYKEKASELPPPPGREDLVKATTITRTIRARILERDNYTCQSCGATDHLCIDHVIPVSRGGSSDDDNLQVLCSGCNTKKGNKLAGESNGYKKTYYNGDSLLVRANVNPKLNQRNRSIPSDSLNPDILNPDILNPESNASCPTPQKSEAPDQQAETEKEVAFLTIPLVTKNKATGEPDEFPVYPSQLSEWAECFPALDIPQVIREIKAWNLANPANRKTKTGILKHINGWLTKEQNKAKPHVRGQPAQARIIPMTRDDRNKLACEEAIRRRRERNEGF